MRGLDTLTHRTTTVTLAAHARRGLIMCSACKESNRLGIYQSTQQEEQQNSHSLLIMRDLQSCSMVTLGPLSLQTRDWTGLEMRMSASTESPITRGESLMNNTTSEGTAAGTVWGTCSA